MDGTISAPFLAQPMDVTISCPGTISCRCCAFAGPACFEQFEQIAVQPGTASSFVEPRGRGPEFRGEGELQ
jgi:hypothetical protein